MGCDFIGDFMKYFLFIFLILAFAFSIYLTLTYQTALTFGFLSLTFVSIFAFVSVYFLNLEIKTKFVTLNKSIRKMENEGQELRKVSTILYKLLALNEKEIDSFISEIIKIKDNEIKFKN